MNNNERALYVWRWKKILPDKYGKTCRILARGMRMNSALIEFEDGKKYVTIRWAIKKVKQTTENKMSEEETKEEVKTGIVKQKQSYYLINIGDDASVKKFETKRELNKHIVTFGVQPSGNIVEAGKGLLEMPDGSKCLIIKGRIKILKHKEPKPVQTKFEIF